jgi:GNAT superfamily N-acetyltransferase
MSDPSRPTIRIDEATPADAPVLLALIRALAEYEKLAHEVRATEEGLRETLFAENSHVHALIARDGDVPIGFAVYFFNYSTFLARPGLYLEDLFVVPERRGEGAGRLLLERLARIALERGCARMQWSVLDWNEPARGFYRSLGAAPLTGWSLFRLTGDPLRRLGGMDDPELPR